MIQAWSRKSSRRFPGNSTCFPIVLLWVRNDLLLYSLMIIRALHQGLYQIPLCNSYCGVLSNHVTVLVYQVSASAILSYTGMD